MEFQRFGRILLSGSLIASACGDDDAAVRDSGVTGRDAAAAATTIEKAPVASDPSEIAPSDAGDLPGHYAADGGFVLQCEHRGGAISVVHVEFRCDEVMVYTCKDLSNLVIEYEDGTTQRIMGVSGHVNAFTGTGANAGKPIARVWVKAGNNGSGEGPGYGERVEAPPQSCTPPTGGGGRGGTGGTCASGPDVSCVPLPTSGMGGGPAAGGGGSSGRPSDEPRPD